MRAPKSLANLPRGKELRSNKLEDIQAYLDRYRKVHDDAYRLLFQDIATFQIDADGFIYLGNKDTDGTWRIGRDGGDYVLDHLESGVWVNATKHKAD